MQKKYPLIISVLAIIAIQSCSKKTYPDSPVVKTDIKEDIKGDTSIAVKKKDSLVVLKPVKRKTKESTPKVIVVNDKYANKSVDGRYYYDLQGHRYWRNNKDGKYYLFHKSMLTDDAFKKPH